MDFDGRIGRRRYIISQLVLMPIFTVSWSALLLALWNLNHGMSNDVIPQILRGAVLPPSLP